MKIDVRDYIALGRLHATKAYSRDETYPIVLFRISDFGAEKLAKMGMGALGEMACYTTLHFQTTFISEISRKPRSNVTCDGLRKPMYVYKNITQTFQGRYGEPTAHLLSKFIRCKQNQSSTTKYITFFCQEHDFLGMNKNNAAMSWG